MEQKDIIISENKRPFWQIIIASLFFTIAIGMMILAFFYITWTEKNSIGIAKLFEFVFYFLALGTMFCFQKSVYIDLKKSRFRSTFEIGPIKLGQWKTIHNFEYVSVFQQPLKNGHTIFEVNLWYDKNKHWELYERDDPREAFKIGYELSEILDIDLLDATVRNDYKWIDKDSLKAKSH